MFVIGIIVHCIVARRIASCSSWSLDAELVRDWLANIGFHLGHPEWQQLYPVGEHRCGAVNELAELRYSLNEVACDELTDPLRRILSCCCLQLDFQYCIGEPLNIIWWELGERIVNANIHSPPIWACSFLSIEIVFSRHSQLCVQRDPHP